MRDLQVENAQYMIDRGLTFTMNYCGEVQQSVSCSAERPAAICIRIPTESIVRGIAIATLSKFQTAHIPNPGRVYARTEGRSPGSRFPIFSLTAP